MNRREAIQTAAIVAGASLPPLPADDLRGGFLVPPGFAEAVERMRNSGVVILGPPIPYVRSNLTIEEVCRLRGVPFDG